MRISVIHASYGRPDLARETHYKWRHSASGYCDIEWILSIDKSDPMHSQYKTLCNDILNLRLQASGMVVNNDTTTSVAAINHAASVSTGDIIVVISDDFNPVHDWDMLLAKALKNKSNFIVKTQDGTQGWIITMPIMDRIYYNHFGYVYHPDYKHMFCDTELTCVADYAGRKIELDILFKHNHYSVHGGIAMDNTSQKADLTWEQGERLFVERYKKDFDIANPIKPVKDQSMINWILKKVR